MLYPFLFFCSLPRAVPRFFFFDTLLVFPRCFFSESFQNVRELFLSDPDLS